MKGRLAVLLVGTVWLCALGVGEWRLLHYEMTAGSPAAPLPDWPAESELPRVPGVFNLLLFAHPRCPCTRATIAELAVVKARCADRLAVTVSFFNPTEAPDDWAETDLWRAAAAIPGATTLCDPAGREARRFGARTSGQVFLYDSHGRLCFQGGITASRGHAGDNRGSQAIYDLVLGIAPTEGTTGVFGCPLHDPCPPTEGDFR